MNFTRRLVFNLHVLLPVLFLLIVLAVLRRRARAAAGRAPRWSSRRKAAWSSSTAATRERALAQGAGRRRRGEVQLRDLLRALDAAAHDKRIERVVLRLDSLQAGRLSPRCAKSPPRSRACAPAASRSSPSAKCMDQEQYLLAAQADEVYLDPMGGMLLEGLGRYRQYYRQGLQDKLGVDVHLFRVGEYKSAAEPYVLDAASPRGEGSRPVLDERRVAALPRPTSRRRASSIAAGPRRRHRHDARRHRRRAAATWRKLRAAAEAGRRAEDAGRSRRPADRTRRRRRGCRRRLPPGLARRPTCATSIRACRAADPRRRSRWSSPKARSAAASSRRARVGGESTAALLREARDDENVKARGAARGFARRRSVRLRADPPRDRRAEGRRQAGRRVDGRPRRVGRLLDLDERRPHLRRSLDHHRFDRHLRPDPDAAARAGEDRRAHRRRRHHALRRRLRHHAPAAIRQSATSSSR